MPSPPSIYQMVDARLVINNGPSIGIFNLILAISKSFYLYIRETMDRRDWG